MSAVLYADSVDWFLECEGVVIDGTDNIWSSCLTCLRFFNCALSCSANVAPNVLPVGLPKGVGFNLALCSFSYSASERFLVLFDFRLSRLDMKLFVCLRNIS